MCRLAEIATAVMATTVAALLVAYFAAGWRYRDPPDVPTRRRRYRIGWEVRGWVLGICVPSAAGMVSGYLSGDFLPAMLLFAWAGFLVAAMIAPSGLC
jgi:hypothetical protein